MTPLETLQALKIQYDVASLNFEEVLKLIRESNPRNKERIKKLEKNADIFGEIRYEIIKEILKIEVVEETVKILEKTMSDLEQNQRDQFNQN